MAQFSNWDNNKLIVDAHHNDLRHSARADHPWQDDLPEPETHFARRSRMITLVTSLFAFVLALIRR